MDSLERAIAARMAGVGAGVGMNGEHAKPPDRTRPPLAPLPILPAGHAARSTLALPGYRYAALGLTGPRPADQRAGIGRDGHLSTAGLQPLEVPSVLLNRPTHLIPTTFRDQTASFWCEIRVLLACPDDPT